MTDGVTTWNYTYDANGMRTSRANGTKTYNYVYNGSQLVQMTVGNDTLHFTYGLLGPTTVTWNGDTYYYALNGQGDVIGIFDEYGTLVVTYNWDNAWGYNPIPEGSMASTLGALNPLRYRGYVYDIETGYYYLQSRYYDPEIGRFINADSFASTGQGFFGNNMFAYCLNNPVCRKDISGTASEAIFDSNGNHIPDEKEHGGHGGTGGPSGPSGNGGRSSVNGASSKTIPSASQGGKVSSNSVAMDPSDALDTAIDFLGSGYVEAYPPGSGRFVSGDGLRQVRIGYDDLLGLHAGAPHMNFEFIGHSASFHVYLVYR